MTAKRYFKRMWEEEYYIFDSNTISESDFEEKLEYQNYKAFEDSMMGDEVVNRLNEQHEQIHFLNMKYAERTSLIGEQSLKIENLEKENEQLKKEEEEYNENAMSYQTLYEQQLKKSERLHEENESLKEENKFLRNKVATYKQGNALLKKSMDKEWK